MFRPDPADYSQSAHLVYEKIMEISRSIGPSVRQRPDLYREAFLLAGTPEDAMAGVFEFSMNWSLCSSNACDVVIGRLLVESSPSNPVYRKWAANAMLLWKVGPNPDFDRTVNECAYDFRYLVENSDEKIVEDFIQYVTVPFNQFLSGRLFPFSQPNRSVEMTPQEIRYLLGSRANSDSGRSYSPLTPKEIGAIAKEDDIEDFAAYFSSRSWLDS